jgi:hypothetical protein
MKATPVQAIVGVDVSQQVLGGFFATKVKLSLDNEGGRP